MTPPILTTRRLRLRPPVAEDAGPLQAYLQDRRVAETTALIPHPYPVGGALEWIQRGREKAEAGGFVSFAIVLRESDEVVGVIDLIEKGRAGTLGYWIAVPHWGNGYATEAAHRVIRLAFNYRGLDSVDACHFAHNPASGRVMQKAGLLCEGVEPFGASRFGERYDRVNYGITAERWRESLRVFSQA